MRQDLKSENVLLTSGSSGRHGSAGWPMLADFGLANWVTDSDTNLTSVNGTPAFVAPEVAAHTGYGAAADWWSLGILCYQMFTLCTPFEGGNARATMANIRDNRRTHTAPVAAPDALVVPGHGVLPARAASFIEALLVPDPTERLGGQLRGNEVRVHPFFWGWDWSIIESRTGTPPHAARCRERARAAVEHISLRLPPLPEVRPL